VTEAVAIGPDERAVRDHLQSARYLRGEETSHWRLVSISWPHAIIAVTAAPREGAPTEFGLKLELSNYPAQAPLGCPWDLEDNVVLPERKRPKGDRVGQIFQMGWENGQALYAPWDRSTLNHGHWLTEHPRYVWRAGRDLTFYLTNTHEFLNDDGYVGI
jgi:hypothetical protein